MAKPPDLTKSKPFNGGHIRGNKRKRKDVRVVASENDQFSISGQARLGTPEVVYKGRKEKMAEAIDKLKVEMPAPKIVDLEISNPVLASIEEEPLRNRVRDFLQLLLGGGRHKEALSSTDFTWQMFQNLKRRYPGLHELWVACRDIGDEYRQVLRADAAHERAVDGVEEPLYSAQGKFLGSKRVYSDRLLELLLKADNPEKYAAKTDVNVKGTVINLTTGFDRAALREEQEAEAIDAEATVT